MSAAGSGMIMGGGVTKQDEQTCPDMSGAMWNCISLEMYDEKKNRRLL